MLDAEQQKIIDGLLTILVTDKHVTEADVPAIRKAFDHSDEDRFEEFLLADNVVTKQQLLPSLQKYYQLPALDVTGVLFDHALVVMFPKDVLLRNGFIPYLKDGDTLQVIASRPHDDELLEIIGNFVSYDVVFLVGIYGDISVAVEDFYDEALTIIDEDEDEATEDEDTEDIVDRLE